MCCVICIFYTLKFSKLEECLKGSFRKRKKSVQIFLGVFCISINANRCPEVAFYTEGFGNEFETAWISKLIR